MLGDMLGRVIADLDGPAALELVETVRLLSRERRSGVHEAEPKLAEKIAALSLDQVRVVVRAFGIFFDLANIAEDRQRVRVLREREQLRHPDSLSESIPSAIAQLKENDYPPERVQQALDDLSIELVFTAHPSEAKRRSIRAKLRRMRHALQELDREDLLPRERGRLMEDLRSELGVLWQTEFLRPVRPTVTEEVERGLSVVPRLWEVVPQIYQSMRLGLRKHFPESEFCVPSFLRFGSWMGGDRDGNPHVTADVTAATLCRLRNAAVEQHTAYCRRMHDYLTISSRLSPASQRLTARIDAAVAQWPPLKDVVERIAPYEIYRRMLAVIAWRLGQSNVRNLEAAPLPGDYGVGAEFEADVRLLCECLEADHEGELVENEVRRWHDLVRVFGLHLFSLDVRQDARRYQEIMSEIFAHLGVSKNYEDLDDAARAKLIAAATANTGDVWPGTLTPLTQDTLRLYDVLHRALVRFGPQCLGGNIISLTRSSADVLTVLWLWRWAKDAAARRGDKVAPSDLRIIPLFEKIGDLKRAPDTLAECLDHPLYAEHLAKQAKRQIVMVGYSDSTKDGGYLAACWGLYRSQAELQQAAAKRGVKLTFFHGRGGSLGRGGGPAARGILSLPSEALDGTLRLTEQGEVLAERYDDVQIAYRHLEQVSWATLAASTVVRTTPKPEWPPLMETLSEQSLKAYRDLVDQPGFIPYFVETTPIEEIEDLPIGSRPARRRGERTLGDLRAIPWVFSWTQNRSMIPAWYGLGASLSEVKYRDRRAWQMLCEMYRSWPFFQAAIDNASLALAKADMYVAQRYAELAEDPEVRERMWLRIASEYDRTRQAVLDVVGERELLSGVPWFQQSIEVRNPYVDPLNLIQIELLRRRRAASGEEDEAYLRHLLRLSVQGVAAGMRTTG